MVHIKKENQMARTKTPPDKPPKKLTKDQLRTIKQKDLMITTLERSLGVVKLASEHCGVSRTNH